MSGHRSHHHVTEPTIKIPLIRGWIIWLVATLFVVYQLTLQTSYGSISKELSSSMELTASQCALLAACFLFTYGIMQLPAGLLLDRTNPRWTLSITALLCGLFTLWFSMSSSFASLMISRSLMGAAAAFAFPGAGLISRRWIRPAQFAMAMGMIDLLFSGGAVFGNAGVSELLKSMPWQQIMMWLAAAGGIIAILILIMVSPEPRGSDLGSASDRIKLKTALKELLSSRQALLGMLFYAGMCGTLFGFYGLWDIPLQEAFGFSKDDASMLNSWLFIGLGIGAFGSGIIADLWGRRKPLLVIGSLGGTMTVALILFAPIAPYSWVMLTLLLNGILLGVSILIFPLVCESLPKGYAAAAIGLVNFAGCVAGGLLQLAPSFFIDEHKFHDLTRYQMNLVIFLAAMVMAVVAAFLLHDTRPGWDNAVHPDNENLDPLPE